MLSNKELYTQNPEKSGLGAFTPLISSDSLLCMSGVILSPKDRAHLLRMMRRQTPSTVHRRMNVLLLLDDGWAAERVAEALFIDAETVREHRGLYVRRRVSRGLSGWPTRAASRR
jgi:DNA-binding NarL/FixJ family response regulator